MQFGGILLTQMSVERISDKVGFKIENEALLCLAIRKLLYLHDNQKENLVYLTEKMNHRWILVSERLPEDDGMYIACFDDDFITAVMYITDRQGAQDWELWADSGEVVAWMPLPEPYKAE